MNHDSGGFVRAEMEGNIRICIESFNDTGVGSDKVVTERFTRVSNKTLTYEATIVDPRTYEDKIVLSFPMARFDGRVYEFACHENNYSMSMILSGARTAEQEATKAKQ